MIQDGPHQMSDLTDEAKAEIAAAVKIVAEDRNSARLRAIHDHLMPPTPENTPPDPDGPQPPPKKDDAPDDPPKKKVSLWWGELPE